MNNNQNQANLPETSAMPEGGDMMMGGNVAMTGQLDPLSVPQMTTTPAVATSSQEIAGSDMATIPTVLETMGGLEPTGLLLTNYAANVVALCNKDIYVRRYNITSETAAETVLDEIDFNPWDPNLVSAPIAIYGGAHQVFNGSIDITINSYSAATIVGSVILSYVPPLLQNGFVPTLQNLTTVPHTILNLKVGGSSKITVTGGNLKDCAVSRSEIENGTSVYGKIYIVAFTDIVNAYGVQVSIPVVRFASLGKDSYFSHPSYLIGEGGGSLTNPGPTPPIVSNLVLDSAVLYNPAGVTSATSFYSPNVTNGTVKLIPMGTFRTAVDPPFGSIPPTSGSFGSLEILRFFWGSNVWGNTYDGIRDAVNDNKVLQSYFVRGDGSGNSEFVGATLSADAVIPVSGVAFTYNGLTVNVSAGDVTGLEERLGVGNVRNAKASLPNASALAVTLQLYNVEDKGGFIDSSGNSVVTYIISTTVPGQPTILENSTNPIVPALDTDQVTFRLFPEADTRATIEFLGAPVLANTPTSVPAPTGYVALYFDNDSFFIPAVLPTASNTRSMPWPRSHNRFMLQAEAFFQLNPAVRSYSYTMTLVTGQILGDILVNRTGVFMYDPVSSATNYAVLSNAGTIVYQNYQSYATEFPAIQEYASEQFVSRVTSALRNYSFKKPFLPTEIKFSEKDESFMFKRVLELEKKLKDMTVMGTSKSVQVDIPEMFAAQLATNAVGGVAGVFNDKAQRQHETEMQKRELRYWTGGQLLDYKKAMRLGNMRADTEMNKARIQRDVAMAQYGYNANATMRGAGNSFNTNSNTSSVGTSTTPLTANASTQAGRVNMNPRQLNSPTAQTSAVKQPPTGSVATPYAQVHIDHPSAGVESMA